MKIYKKLKPFISLVCVVLLIFSTIAFSVAAASTNSVTASTGATVKQGSIAYCYVYIDSVEGLAALDVTVHFDASKVKILNVYNSVSCTLYDSVTNTDNVQFSYIFNGKGATSKTRLFYFQYQALSNAEIGDSHFDITIGEAYDNSLNTVEVSGSRCNFKIAETVTSKTCSVSGSSSVASSIKNEFTLDYQFSTYQIASGTVVITYDPELFEVVSVTNGEFLSGKIADINAELLGEIYISFVSTEYNTKRNFVSVTFRTIKNVTETSEIIFKAAELIDKDLNSISCNPYKTKVDLTFDKTYAGDAPSMKLDGTFSYDDMKITLVVSLEKDSRLGAGDFVIKFDPELVAYNSCTKGFSPTFFNINDKNVEKGELKFHIISLSDIVTEETVLTVEFDVKNPYFCETADFTLEGTGITDSLTETVSLNFVDGSVWLEYQIKFLDYNGTLLQSGMYHYGDTVQEPAAPTRESDEYGIYTFSGWDKEVTPCTAETVYTATYYIEYTEYTVIFKNWDGTEISRTTYHYGDVVAIPDTPAKEKDSYYIYNFDGWDKEVVNCSGNAEYTAVFSAEHYHTYEKDITLPDCTNQGFTLYTCACGDTYEADYVDALGHDYKWITDKAENCGETGLKHEKCSRCGDVRNENTVIPATGNHSYTSEVTTQPSCTVNGVETFTCTVCGDTYNKAISVTGHSPSTAVIENRVEPQCEIKGSYDEVIYCSVCFSEISRIQKEIDETGHSYSTQIISPDCLKKGYTLYTCSACGDTYEADYVDALGHDYKWITDKAENCGETGLKHEKCNRCGDVRNENTVIPATGNHSYTSEVTTQPSCTVNGVETFTCTVCGDTYNKAVSATGHSYSSQTVLPDCTNQGFTLYTCACGDTYTENVIPPNGHVLGDWVVSKDESGNFNGKIEAKCINCDFVCTEDSPEHQVVFSVDGEVYDAYNCKFGDSVTVPDDPMKKGYAFVGWTPAIPETMPNNEMTFTAVFEPIIYTATFVADGNTVDIIEFSVENQNVVAPSIPQKVGYTAVWDEYEVNLADFTVNAVYTPIIYTATFVADGNTVDIIEFSVENQKVVAPSIPEKVGYTAVWEGYEVTLADFTVNAVYTPIVYTATFMSDGKVIGTDTFTVEDSSLDYPYIVKWAYYDWIWDEHKIEAENLTIEGRYVPITYTITFVSNGKVIKTQEYNVNTVDSIVAPAKSLSAKQHYTTEWENWTGKVGNITVNEIYVPIKYKISFYCQDRLIATRSYTIENSQSQIALPSPVKIDGYNAEWPKFNLEYKDQTVHAVYTPIVYTATFVADGKVVATRTFTVETESLNEPPVPQKSGYYACWSGYTIGAKDITIVAKYHLPEVVAVSKRTMNVGDTFRILASCNFETTGKTWASSDTSVATVNQHGEVTAVGKGKCKITTTCYGKDSLGNDIQASKTTIIIVNDNSESDNSKRSFRELFDEFFEVTLHDILYNLREFMLVLFRYAY